MRYSQALGTFERLDRRIDDGRLGFDTPLSQPRPRELRVEKAVERLTKRDGRAINHGLLLHRSAKRRQQRRIGQQAQ